MRNVVLKRVANTGYVHWCPGCKERHVVPDSFAFNGSFTDPTFSPSMLITTESSRCHYFLTDGKIQYLRDSTHYLSGGQVRLPPLPSMDQ